MSEAMSIDDLESGTAEQAAQTTSNESKYLEPGDANPSSEDSVSDRANAKRAEEPSGAVSTGQSSDDVYVKAKALGFNDDDLKTFSDTRALSLTVDRLSKLNDESSAAKKQVEQFTAWYQANAPLIEQAMKAQSQPETPAEDDFDLDPEVYDEKLVKTFKALKTKLSTMESAFQMVAGSARQQQETKALEEFDSAVQLLDDEFGGVFGKGAITTMDASAESVANRRRAKDTAALLAQVFPNESPAQLARRAASVLFGEKLQSKAKEQAVKEVVDMARDSQGRFTGTASHRAMKTSLTPDEEAVEAIKDKYYEYSGGRRP